MPSQVERLIAALNGLARDAESLARESSELSHELKGLSNSRVAAASEGALHASGEAAATAHERLVSIARAARSYTGRT